MLEIKCKYGHIWHADIVHFVSRLMSGINFGRNHLCYSSYPSNIYGRMQISSSWNECNGSEARYKYGCWCCCDKLEKQSTNDRHFWRNSSGMCIKFLELIGIFQESGDNLKDCRTIVFMSFVFLIDTSEVIF